MGNRKQKWTSEEEDALRAGVSKHGTGKWKIIQRDPEFSPYLSSRSNIDLKDKWRNMSVSTTCPNTNTREGISPTKPISRSDAPMQMSANGESSDITMQNVADDGSSRAQTPMYNELIIEAILALKEPNGSEASSIFNYIEQQQIDMPPNFRRLLSSRLRRLVAQEKIEKVEKVQSGYKINKDSPSEMEIASPLQTIPPRQDIRPKQSQSKDTTVFNGSVQDAAMTAAYKIAEAENKSFVAAEAVKEAERVQRLYEEAELILEIAKEIVEKSEPMSPQATSTPRIRGAVGKCRNCNIDPWLLHEVRLRGTYQQLCTSCVLILHPSSFCPACFTFYDLVPPHPSKRIACGSCSSFSHIHCVTAPSTGNHLCPPCNNNPSFSFFHIKGDPKAALATDEKLAKAHLCASQIGMASMGKAVLVARAEAERKVREAALGKKRAGEALHRAMGINI